jgi:FKBP-type peptidyl-prolyl cis-trans isomerase
MRKPAIAIALGLVLLLGAACHREAKPVPPASPTPPPEAVPRTIDRGDGLSVEITKDGYGPVSKIGDEMSLAYTARTKSSGEVIASTRDWSVPFRVRLGEKGVLPGLARALEGLRAGTMARIEIPPALAYGKDGIPGSSVPPDETLVFEVEILGVR